MIDLHAHTTASDGDLSPAALVARAAAHGVRVLAVTDHDTLAGVEDAMAAGTAHGVTVIPGIELTVTAAQGSFHLVGLFPHPRPAPLAGRLDELAHARELRARRILELLDGLGMPVGMEDVRRHTTGTIGRPHIAQALVDAGHCADRREAFERVLGDGRPAWIPQTGLAPAEAVRLVRDGGGAAVIAHPWSLRLGHRGVEATAAALVRHGLVGLEVHRPEVLPDQRDAYARIARRLGLVASGGSDFHTPGAGAELGHTGTPGLPADACERLFTAIGQRVPSVHDHS
ncbi:MAG: PHP domain-containing protein [Thermoleophilia bacterium]